MIDGPGGFKKFFFIKTTVLKFYLLMDSYLGLWIHCSVFDGLIIRIRAKSDFYDRGPRKDFEIEGQNILGAATTINFLKILLLFSKF